MPTFARAALRQVLEARFIIDDLILGLLIR